MLHKTKPRREVRVHAEWRRHRDDYVRTGSLSAFRHMLECVTIDMVRDDPNDTPSASQ